MVWRVLFTPAIILLIFSSLNPSVLTNSQARIQYHLNRSIASSNLNPRQGEANIFTGCSDPSSDIYQRDLLKSIDEPKFVDVSEASEFMQDEFPIMGVYVNGEIRGYPINILNHHEVVNDYSRDINLGITYCPLTGSAVSYDLAELGGEIGVTGILLDSNLVFYDRSSNSCFSQLLNQGISGDKSGLQLYPTPSIETTWKTWKKLFPESLVLGMDTGYNFDSLYRRNFYESYAKEDSIFFGQPIYDWEPYNLYSTKLKTLILQSNDQTHLFPFDELNKSLIVNTKIGETAVSIFYDYEHLLAIPYVARNTDNTTLNFEVVEDRSDLSIDRTYGLNVFQDQFGEIWNMRGMSVNSAGRDQNLDVFPGFTAYWYAAILFYPTASIFTINEIKTYNIVPEGHILENPQGSYIFGLIFLGSIVLLFTLTIIYARRTKISK
ncbi:MAG: DUF3179 domain-containing protein [Candidatus Heimdallarchaeota archaeon]|nr:DUF3179 domain-containing protein [Candidatus Heimdallarchaeota archaeon]